MIVGMAGKARQGKDTVGSELANRIGCGTYSLALPMKIFTHLLLGWNAGSLFEDSKNVEMQYFITTNNYQRAMKYATDSGLWDYIDNPEVLEPKVLKECLGVRDNAGYIAPREAWQRIGTEWGRVRVKDTIWIDQMPKNDIVVTDVRFDNEADYIRNLGGVIIHVSRDEKDRAGGVPGHASEAGVAFKEGDITFDNTGNLVDLRANVLRLVKEHFS